MWEYLGWAMAALVGAVGVGLGVRLAAVVWRVCQLRRRARIVPTELERQYRKDVKLACLVAIGLGVGFAITLVQR